MELPSPLTAPRSYPQASPKNLLIISLHIHLDPLVKNPFLLVVYPEISLLTPPKTLLKVLC